MSLRFVVRTFLSLQRFEIFLAVMLPFFLIFESSLANGSVYAGGHLNFLSLVGLIAFGRGLFFEVLTYASAKLTKVLIARGHYAGAALPGLIAVWCIIVSAGNNLGWVLSGGDFDSIFASMGHLMPSAFLFSYKMGLGLLLPLSVGILALVDVSHLIEEAMERSALDEQATEVIASEMNRKHMTQALKTATKETAADYQAIAKAHVQQYVKRAQSGDLSFSTHREPKQVKAKITPVQPAQIGPTQQRGQLPPPQQPIPGQGYPAQQYTQPMPGQGFGQPQGQPFPGQFPPNLQPQGQQGYYRQ
ncbi:hypothetical protein KSC_086690 [Ktedonobacter sp. SOSP1-52]|uniref:hypothetical protein n=1 Tax=Ktedonobacter sp. SOSP1-52 TaxID=2778366 RepID=UPI0019167B52|nr:hypothetical protein [Ktedonobacter sp. SOSP1-52]GHO69777.1 hypothetical protein KSC_086690 [Ktedonobacter sp. SOSP1-52]